MVARVADYPNAAVYTNRGHILNSRLWPYESGISKTRVGGA